MSIDWTGSINGIAYGDDTAYKLQGVTGWFDYTAAPLGGAQVGSGSVPAPKSYDNGSWPVPYWVPSRDVTLVLEVVGIVARSGQDAAITSGSNVVTAASGNFRSGDVARTITFYGAGAAGADLTTEITTVQSSTQILVADAPAKTGAGISWSLAESAFAENVKRLAAATVPDGTNKDMWLQAIGDNTHVSGNITARSIPLDNAFQSGLAIATITLECTDPRRLSDVMSASASMSSGSASVAMDNTGDMTGPLTVTLTGPMTAPTVAAGSGSGQVAFKSGYTLAAGSTLVVDMENRSAMVNGTTSVANQIGTRSWFGLTTGRAAGSPAVTVTATGTTAASQVAISGKSAWL